MYPRKEEHKDGKDSSKSQEIERCNSDVDMKLCPKYEDLEDLFQIEHMLIRKNNNVPNVNNNVPTDNSHYSDNTDKKITDNSRSSDNTDKIITDNSHSSDTTDRRNTDYNSRCRDYTDEIITEVD